MKPAIILYRRRSGPIWFHQVQRTTLVTYAMVEDRSGYRTQNWRTKSPSAHHDATIAQICRSISSQRRHVSTIEKNLLNSNISSTSVHNMANFGPLTAEIGSGVWGTPANFNGFCVLASLLQQRCAADANQTLYDVWPSSVLVHCYVVYSFSGALASWRNFAACKIHFASKSCLVLYWQCYCTALQHRASAKLCGMLQGMELCNFRRGCYLYSAGRPSRWA